MRGVFETRPSLPRYKDIWDVSTVLEYLKTLHPPEDLTLKELTLKLTMLLALLSAQRCQTLQALSIGNMVLTDDKCSFHFSKPLKTSRPLRSSSCNIIYSRCKPMCDNNIASIPEQNSNTQREL